MTESRAELLTDTQIDYLHLVREGRTSKEIAQLRGASHHTVNAQIAVAVRLLGARSRAHAAELLVEKRQPLKIQSEVPLRGSYEPSYEPAHIADRTESVSSSEPEARPARPGGFALPVKTASRPLNDLGPWQRIFWIAALAALLALIVGGLVSGIVAQLHALGERV